MSEAEQTQGTAGRLLAGRYRLGGILGRGGMGTVWRATDETLGRTVAVKELRFPANIDEDEKRRLITRTLREAKAIARIRSAGAVTVYDVVHEDDRPWIVMELIEGRSLADVIREDGPLKWRRAAEVGLAVLDVLSAAHRQGILHRDVKPSNVLIADDNRVVLTDFGIAQVEGDPSVTSTGMLVGAPSYISPERARGQKPGPPADLWSLGGLLYAAVEGVPPYDKGSAIATLTAVMTEPLGPPRNAGPLEGVMYGLLAKDPAKRLDEAGARALLADAVNAPDERLPKPPEASPALDATQAIALPSPAEMRSGTRPSSGAGTGAAAGAASASASASRKGDTRASAKPSDGSRATDGVGDRMRGAFKSVRGAAPDTGAKPTRPANPAPSIPSAQRQTGLGRPGSGNGAHPARPGRASITDVVSRRTLLAVAVIVALAIIGTVLAITLNGDDDKGTKGGTKSGTSKSVGDKGTSSLTEQGAKGADAASPAPGKDKDDASKDESDKSSDSDDLPGGYTAVKNAEYHFSIAMPKGWRKTGTAGAHSGAIYSQSGGFPRLQVDFGSEPGSDAAAAWRDSDSAAKSGGMPNYRGLGVEEVDDGDGHDYPTIADWTFERDQKDKRVQVVNRGFKVDDKRGYAIMVTCEKGKWSEPECQKLRETAFKTFQPA
ncbi:protein kinase [Streptomyces netropsis]|uniref:serine/threonine-protein kinase n=1 Tax=Streptomyces netropsis TaxID=55404 RepID=UPI0037A0E744